MQSFSEKDLSTFEKILMLDQKSLKTVLSKFLKKHYKEVVDNEYYLYSKGDIPIALVAHLDTVFSTPPTNIFYDSRKNVLWSPEGLGSDDRAGIFAILKIIHSGLHPHIIFTTDEEIGGIGAEALSKITCPFKELKYIIQLDRRGKDDCVFYYCNNIPFIEYVESFGFLENWGSFSDISILCPKWEVAGVNLSIGYENEHSFSEILYLDNLMATINKVKNMLKEKHIPFFKYVPSYTYTKSLFEVKCSCCGKSFPFNSLNAVKTKDGNVRYYCEKCCNDEKNHIEQCEICYEYFESDEISYQINICEDCMNKIGF